jgi:hypothetical protein
MSLTVVVFSKKPFLLAAAKHIGDRVIVAEPIAPHHKKRKISPTMARKAEPEASMLFDVRP